MKHGNMVQALRPKVEMISCGLWEVNEFGCGDKFDEGVLRARRFG